MKNFRILLIVVGLLISFALASCGIFKHGSDVTLLVVFASSYRVENDKWPKDEKELRAYAEDEGLKFDWSQLSRIQFTPKDDGSLFLEAEFAPAKSGAWSATIKVPKEAKKAGNNTR